jgi:ABC-type sugar transport system substrate-binding protein
MKKRQITIKDIAKALHISPSTVSRSLADHPDISQETKNIVNAYAREHKYKPNALALSLRTNNTKTIGVILPQIVHYFFSSVLSGIEDEAEKGGYRVIICQSNENYEKEVKGAQALLEARVCGVLASVAKTTTAPMPIKKVWIEKPVVCCSSGSISPTKARKGSIVTLMEASMIINIPAPINTGDKIAVSVPGDKNNPAFGINIKAIVVKIAPTRKNGRRRPKRHHVWSE